MLKSLWKKLAVTHLYDLSWTALWVVFTSSLFCTIKGFQLIGEAVAYGNPVNIVIASLFAFAGVIFIVLVHNDLQVKEDRSTSTAVRRLVRDSSW